MLGVRPALEHANVSIRTRAVVTRLETNATGSAVERVIVERDDTEETYDADIVVVSAGAANSAKILLASASDRHGIGVARQVEVFDQNAGDQYRPADRFTQCDDLEKQPGFVLGKWSHSFEFAE